MKGLIALKNHLYFLTLLITVFFLILAIIIYGTVFAKDSTKKAYITFDDGPTLNTPTIVSILNKHNAKATFFVLEERIIMYPDYIKDILHSGHAIGLHGVSHSPAIYEGEGSPLKEMQKTNSSLKALTGKESHLVRVPFGSSYKLTKAQYQLLCDNGYLLWDWNVDPRDSVGKIYSENVLKNLKRDLAKCTAAPVILFHDRKSTANLIEEVVIYLKDQGYELAPLSEKQTPLNYMED